MLYVFNTCKHFIRTVPNLVYDEKNVEDINTEGEDHILRRAALRLYEEPDSTQAEQAPRPGGI